MNSKPTLPLETIETVIETLAQDDLTSLKTCSLVCQCFLDLCRKHIFASITIDSRTSVNPRHNIAALVRLLSTAPEIANHIRKLNWNILVSEFNHPLLPGILHTITKLGSLTIRWPYGRRRWSDNPLRSAILHLLHLPTLVHLDVYGILDLDFFDLIPCTNLIEFRLSCTYPVMTSCTFESKFLRQPVRLHRLSFDTETSTSIPAIGTSLRPDGKPIFDLSVLASLSLILHESKAFEASRQLLQHCSQLTDIDISLATPPLTWAGMAKMLNPSVETLTRLRFSIITKDKTGTNDPLGGLVIELEEMRHKNIIESIAVHVSIPAYYKCSLGDEWGSLDLVLTQTGWPMLRNVSLTISIWSTYYDDDDDPQVGLSQLPQTQFLRLSSSKSIAFQFLIVDESLDEEEVTEVDEVDEDDDDDDDEEDI